MRTETFGIRRAQSLPDMMADVTSSLWAPVVADWRCYVRNAHITPEKHMALRSNLWRPSEGTAAGPG